MKLYPKCHPSWNVDGKIIKNTPKTPEYTADGYIVPCCWCDCPDKTDFKKFGLYDEKLKLKNVDSVDQIYKSSQWINFHYMLLNNPEDAPAICKKGCSHNTTNIQMYKPKK